PVVAGLSHAITGRGLDRGFLDAAIAARERELEEGPPTTFMDFERHLAATNGGIARAAVTMLGADDAKVLSIADRLGVSLGWLEKLRWFGDGGRELPLWLPKTLLHEHGLADVDPVGQEPDQRQGGGEVWSSKIDGLQNQLAALAREQLGKARSEQSLISRHLLCAFFPGTLADVRLRDLGRSEAHPAIATAPYRLCWYWLRGRF
ncbi:MAG: squalene/phytoene synthase family protein, partial [Geminicoccaceae bacterium]